MKKKVPKNHKHVFRFAHAIHGMVWRYDEWVCPKCGERKRETDKDKRHQMLDEK